MTIQTIVERFSHASLLTCQPLMWRDDVISELYIDKSGTRQEKNVQQ